MIMTCNPWKAAPLVSLNLVVNSALITESKVGNHLKTFDWMAAKD